MDTVFLRVNAVGDDDGVVCEHYLNLRNVVDIFVDHHTNHMWITDVNHRNFNVDDESRDIILRQLQENMR